jgi:hypothetical protein
MTNSITLSHKEWDMILRYIDFLLDVEDPCHKCPEVQKSCCCGCLDAGDYEEKRRQIIPDDFRKEVCEKTKAISDLIDARLKMEYAHEARVTAEKQEKESSSKYFKARENIIVKG